MSQNFNNMVERIRSCYSETKQELNEAAQSVAPSGLIQKYEDFIDYLVSQYNSAFLIPSTQVWFYCMYYAGRLTFLLYSIT